MQGFIAGVLPYHWAQVVNIAGGDKGDALNRRIMAGSYPGIVKTKLDGVDQTDYLAGRSEKSAREVFFYYTGAQPSAVARRRRNSSQILSSGQFSILSFGSHWK